MALIIVTGFPGSGKTTWVNAIQLQIEKETKYVVKLIREEDHPMVVYGTSVNERKSRCQLRSSVQHALDSKCVVIVDALNYIKGFRYELYCLAKARGLLSMICHANTSLTSCDVVSPRWTMTLVEALVKRYEMPCSRKFDKPCFTWKIHDVEDNMHLNDILKMLTTEKKTKVGKAVMDIDCRNRAEERNRKESELKENIQD